MNEVCREISVMEGVIWNVYQKKREKSKAPKAWDFRYHRIGYSNHFPNNCLQALKKSSMPHPKDFNKAKADMISAMMLIHLSNNCFLSSGVRGLCW